MLLDLHSFNLLISLVKQHYALEIYILSSVVYLPSLKVLPISTTSYTQEQFPLSNKICQQSQNIAFSYTKVCSNSKAYSRRFPYISRNISLNRYTIQRIIRQISSSLSIVKQSNSLSPSLSLSKYSSLDNSSVDSPTLESLILGITLRFLVLVIVIQLVSCCTRTS